jgi:hypothetical protein
MTPEQTLDWLAQQHFDQCREDRPVQHWIRKMKSELPEQRTWVGLTDEERLMVLRFIDPKADKFPLGFKQIVESIEQLLKEKNT